MKKSPSRAVLLMLLFAAINPVSLHAQFFKNLLNTVKQTSQGRANDKASQATNKAIDKADPTTKTGSGGSSSLSNSGGPSSPGDTSAAGATMKALGLFVGGGGVSAADSAAAIKNFMSSSGGSGVFYQYQTTATSKKSGTGKDTTFTYFTNSGSGRNEMRINMPGAMSGKIIIIGRAGQPKYSVSLYPDTKTYSLNIIDTSLINAVTSDYKVTRIGSETVDGYSCTHVKMTSTTGSGIFKSKSTMDLWTSTDVPGYALYKKLVSVQNMKPQMMQALDNAGAGGFIVKMETVEKDYSMGMELIRAEEKSFPASLFEIPAGYTETDENMMVHMMRGMKK
ncbi:MAG TPA: DUF4412 domain-containing protein [Puia sp.]|nr:DUF4412 domain-containing protein [Puia sp.]